MRELIVSYSTFAQVVGDNGFTVYEMNDGNRKLAYAGNRSFVYRCNVKGNTAYDAALGGAAIIVEAEDDAVALLVGTPTAQQYDSQGRALTAIESAVTINVASALPARTVQVVEPMANGLTTKMDVNGNNTAQLFKWTAPAGETWQVTEVRFAIIDSGSMDTRDFGAKSGNLSNGLQLIADLGGIEYELTNLKHNLDIETTFERRPDTARGEDDDEGGHGWLDEEDYFSGVLKFDPPLQLVDGDFIAWRVRDNLKAITDMRSRVVAYRELS